MAHKIGERRRFTVFFTHEQQRNEGRKKHRSCGQLKSFKTHERAEPIAGNAVSYLVMVLRENNESVGRSRG